MGGHVFSKEKVAFVTLLHGAKEHPSVVCGRTASSLCYLEDKYVLGWLSFQQRRGAQVTQEDFSWYDSAKNNLDRVVCYI